MRNEWARSVSRAALILIPALAFSTSAHADDADRYQMELTAGYKMDRFQSRSADSLGLSLIQSAVERVDFDFCVLKAPMPGDAKPALHVLGSTASTTHVVDTRGFVPNGVVDPPARKSLVLEVTSGVMLSLPMDLVDHGAGSALRLGYVGGLTITNRTGYDFMRIGRVVLGFERTRGYFTGSLFEVAYGRNETYGREFGSKRWLPHMLVRGRLFRTPQSVRAGDTAGHGASPVTAVRDSPIHVILDLAADTDGRGGADDLTAMIGLTFDTGGLLRRFMRETE